jgi:hypothetical protein
LASLLNLPAWESLRTRTSLRRGDLADTRRPHFDAVSRADERLSGSRPEIVRLSTMTPFSNERSTGSLAEFSAQSTLRPLGPDRTVAMCRLTLAGGAAELARLSDHLKHEVFLTSHL